jgi:hypothetical protein
LPVNKDILLQEIESNVEIEYCRHPNWAEIAHKSGLTPFFDLMDALMDGKYKWQSSEEQH